MGLNQLYTFCAGDSSSLSRDKFEFAVQSIYLEGTDKNTIAVNFAVGKLTSSLHHFSQLHYY